MMFSMLRDDYPWLYEGGIKLYRAMEGGNSKEIERARKTIIKMIEMTPSWFVHARDMGSPEDEETMMALHHFVRNLERLVRTTKRPTSSDAKSPKEGE